MTVVASHGQGPATGWPIAAVLITRPAASAPPATTRPVDGASPRRQTGASSAARATARTIRASRARPAPEAAVALSREGSNSEPGPLAAAYGPWNRKLPTAAAATATAPQVAIRRSRADDQPPGQQTSARTGTPTARARPANPIQRSSGRATATTGSVWSRVLAAEDGTSSPSPTTNE